MEEKAFLNTREVAKLLDINEKMVYSLISEKGLPATKATGKWLFPRRLVEQWLENHTVNYPKGMHSLPAYEGLLIVSGSNDILLDRSLSLFNRLYADHAVVFGNLGSLGGIRALRRGLCHIASSHLIEEDQHDYNFSFAKKELGQQPAVVNFCRREQGMLLQKGNPKEVREDLQSLCRQDVRLVNRPLGTGTRLLFDKKLREQGVETHMLAGYESEVTRHLDVGLEILADRADAGPGIRAVAGLLGLDFISWGWERFDLIMFKERYFEEGIQLFMGLLHEESFRRTAADLQGYDLRSCGKMIFPQEVSA